MQFVLDQLLAALGAPHLGLLIGAAVLGGVVRGFTGFGFAMVFVPLASMLVGPVAAVGLIWIINFPFILPLAVNSVRQADWGEVLPLFAGSTLVMPLGVWLLTHLDRLTTRWIITVAVSAALVSLVSGWRYAGRPSHALSFGVGGLSGFVNGIASIGGVPLVVFWLGSQHKTARQARDNLQTFFLLSGLMSAPILAWGNVLTTERLALGALLCIPYGIGLLAGVKGFWLSSDQTFRRISYAVIAFSVLAAMPLWDGWLGR